MNRLPRRSRTEWERLRRQARRDARTLQQAYGLSDDATAFLRAGMADAGCPERALPLSRLEAVSEELHAAGLSLDVPPADLARMVEEEGIEIRDTPAAFVMLAQAWFQRYIEGRAVEDLEPFRFLHLPRLRQLAAAARAVMAAEEGGES